MKIAEFICDDRSNFKYFALPGSFSEIYNYTSHKLNYNVFTCVSYQTSPARKVTELYFPSSIAIKKTNKLSSRQKQMRTLITPSQFPKQKNPLHEITQSPPKEFQPLNHIPQIHRRSPRTHKPRDKPFFSQRVGISVDETLCPRVTSRSRGTRERYPGARNSTRKNSLGWKKFF